MWKLKPAIISFYLKEKLTKYPIEKLLKVKPDPSQLITQNSFENGV